jgi:muconolactone delta-isomerase
MLFDVRMDVSIPRDLDATAAEKLLADEKAQAQELQRAGTWRHLWRIVGHYANISVFDVETPLGAASDPDFTAPFPVHEDHSDTALRSSVFDWFGRRVSTTLLVKRRAPWFRNSQIPTTSRNSSKSSVE